MAPAGSCMHVCLVCWRLPVCIRECVCVCLVNCALTTCLVKASFLIASVVTIAIIVHGLLLCFFCIFLCLKEQVLYDRLMNAEWPWHLRVRAYGRRLLINLIIVTTLVLAGWAIYETTVISIDAARTQQMQSSSVSNRHMHGQIRIGFLLDLNCCYKGPKKQINSEKPHNSSHFKTFSTSHGFSLLIPFPTQTIKAINFRRWFRRYFWIYPKAGGVADNFGLRLVTSADLREAGSV